MSDAHRHAHALLVQGDVTAARKALGQLSPYDVHTARLEVGVLMAERRFSEAYEILLMQQGQRPGDFTVPFNLGMCAYETGRFPDAADHYRRSLVLNWSYAKTWMKLAACHLVQQNWAEALACYERASALAPKDAEVCIGLGTMLSVLEDNEGAIRSYRKTLQLNPKGWEAEVALGFVLLRSGQWTEGWKRFEKRHQLRQLKAASGSGVALWVGPPRALSGKRVLVVCEQGFGDSLQFCRYLALVAGRAEICYLRCPPSLVHLFGSLPDVILISDGSPLPDYDIVTALMSLPLIFGTTLNNVPPPARFNVASRRIPGARIGLCWHGGARHSEPLAHADDKRRSVPLETFQPVIEACGGQAVSLQEEDLRDWGVKDWQDTADIIAGLDLVVTVDTAIAHLAASLGVETWILCRAGGCWRWLSEGDRTVWYPSTKLYRQRELSNWHPTVQMVAADLEEWMASHGQ